MESITNLFVVLFESFGLYSTEGGLGDHLIGLDMNCNDASSQNIYNMIFYYFLVKLNTIFKTYQNQNL